MRGLGLLALVAACGGHHRDAVNPATPPAGDAGVEEDAAGSSGAADGGAGDAAAIDLRPINRPGDMVEIDDLVVPGKVTIIDFWADWCGPCKEVEVKLVAALAGRDGFVVRKIDIRDDSSAVARHYDIGVLPHLRIYGRDGVLVYALIGDNAYRVGELALEVLGHE